MDGEIILSFEFFDDTVNHQFPWLAFPVFSRLAEGLLRDFAFQNSLQFLLQYEGFVTCSSEILPVANPFIAGDNAILVEVDFGEEDFAGAVGELGEVLFQILMGDLFIVAQVDFGEGSVGQLQELPCRILC